MDGMVYLQPFAGEHGSSRMESYGYSSYDTQVLADASFDRTAHMEKHLETLEKTANGFNRHLMLEVPQRGFSRLHLDSPWEPEAYPSFDRTARYVSPSGPYGGDLTTASDSPSSPTEDWSPQMHLSQVSSHPNNLRSPQEWTPCSNELPFMGQNFWTPEHSRLSDIEHVQPSSFSGTAVTPKDIQRYPDPTPDVSLEESGVARLPPQPQHLKLSTDHPVDASDSEYDALSSQDTTSDGDDPDYSPSSRRRSSMSTSKHSATRSPTTARRALPRRNTSTAETYRVSKTPSAVNKQKTKPSKKKSRAVTTAAISEGKLPRPFLCPFAPYGCLSTFSAKNEWKRHVSSQHLQLGFYRCDIGACNPTFTQSPINVTRQHNDFNRKDLFTQHLRRMHTPWTSAKPPSARAREDFEKSLELVRDRCWVKRRGPPLKSACGWCGQRFEGEGSWEERMEHVGRHIEKGTAPGDEAPDEGLRDWAISVGVVREVSPGVYRLWGLSGDNGFGLGGEEDAEGDLE